MKVKKILSGILTAVLCVGIMAGTVMADPSASARTVNVINNDSNKTDKYVINNNIEETSSYQKLKSEQPAVADAIAKVNAAKGSSKALVEEFRAMANDASLPESVRKSAQKVLEQIEGKEGLTLFFDIDKSGENVTKDAAGNYIVTINVPALTSSVTGIMVLHFNMKTLEWEVLTVENGGITNVDPEKQTITLKLSSLSPVIVLCNGGDAGSASAQTGGTAVFSRSGAAAGTASSSDKTATSSTAASSAKSPKTEDTSDRWMGFAVAAVVLAAGAVFVLRKRKA